MNNIEIKTWEYYKKKTVSLFWAIVITCVFDNFLTTTYSDSNVGTICSAIFVVLTLIHLFQMIIKNEKISFKFLATVIVIVSIFISFVLNDSNFSATVLISSIILFSAIYSKKNSLESFYLLFRKIMLVIISFTFFLNFLYLIGVDISFLPLLANTKGTLYYVGFLGNVHANSASSFLRLSGIWWEPGVFAAYLIVSIMLELYLLPSPNKKYLFIFSVALVFTFSTMGYICFLLILISFLFRDKNGNLKTKLFVSLILFITLLFICFYEPVFNMLFSKIIEGGESFKDRYHSVGANFAVISQNPIFGLGTVKSTDVIRDYLTSHGLVRSLNNLNTPLAFFSVFGFLPGLFYNYHVIKFSGQVTRSKISRIVIYIMLILLISSTNYMFSLFFTVLFFLKSERTEKRSR